MFLAKNKELLARFKAGEREAMEEVYNHYCPGVRRFLGKGFTFRSGTNHFFFKGIFDEGDLDSSVQEVFRRALEEKARLSYNGVSSFSNWVLAIARNMVINQFRNRETAISQYVSSKDERNYISLLDDSVSEKYSGLLYATAPVNQERLAEQNELKVLIDNFMNELSEEDQKILVLRFAEGVGQEESAKRLGSTRMKVRTAEAKLRSRLRAYLRNTGYNTGKNEED